MAPRPKPDASFASNRLTTTNYNRPSLLSTFRGGQRRTRAATARQYKENYVDSSEDPLSTKEITKRKRPEPSIYDPPQSTTEDESGSDNSGLDDSDLDQKSRKVSTWSARELEIKLAEGDAKAEEEQEQSSRTPYRTSKNKLEDTPRAGAKRRIVDTPQTARKRASPELSRHSSVWSNQKSEQDSDENKDIFGFRTTRKRQSTYCTRGFRNIHTPLGKKDHATTKFKSPVCGPDHSDGAVHSSQAASDAPVFKQPLSFPTDGPLNPSFPTDTNDGAESNLDLDPDGSTSPLSSISSTISLTLDPEDKALLSKKSPAPTCCPVCTERVDEAYLKENPLKDLNVRKQMQFCRAHRIWTAEREWVVRGYPTIDWDGLEKRIECHLSDLEDVLLLRKPSFFRDSLGSSAEGKRESIRLTAGSEGLDKMSAGYYGARGSKMMSDAIISRFSPNIRELALSDSLVKAAGPSGYVQAVLVPELTVMLVKEDMGVDDEGARKVMVESMSIGDLLNEVPDDAVKKTRQRPLIN
ncbi:hypothetical protein VTO42DRAFT_6852 [Malbranchea cinnamomea]